MSAISLILNTFLVATLNATGYANFSIVELDRSIKRQPIEIKENADTFVEIDAQAQVFLLLYCIIIKWLKFKKKTGIFQGLC